jgi:ABC-type branched-subunit amino acid transport system substrate-binding protein
MAAACEQKQPDYSAELNQIKKSNADALLVNLLEEESAMFFRQAKKVGLNVFLFTVNTGISVDACRLGKEAVDGVYGTSGYEYSAPDPGCQRLAKYYKERYGVMPDNEFMKGYNAVYLVKTGIELAKSFDKEKFVEKMHNIHITSKIQPNIVGGSLYYDETGELHAWEYLTKIEWDGKEAQAKALAAIPPLKGPDSDKKVIYYTK